MRGRLLRRYVALPLRGLPSLRAWPCRVDALVQQPARRQPSGARLGKGHDRILAKGQPDLPAGRLHVGHAREFCPVRHDLEIHAVSVSGAQILGILDP